MKLYSTTIEFKEQQFFTKVRDGNLSACEAMVKSGVDINATSSIGYNALHYAVQWAHLTICKWLIDNAILVNTKGNSGETPFHLAYYKQNPDIINLLLNNGADPNITSGWGYLPSQWDPSKQAAATEKALSGSLNFPTGDE